MHEVGIIDDTEWELALSEELPSAPPHLPNLAPHVIDKAISKGQKGKWVSSNLDMFLQEEVGKVIAYHNEKLSENEIHNACTTLRL